MLQAARDRILIFRAGQNEIGFHAERSSRCRMMFSNSWRARSPLMRVGVENSDSGVADRAGLQDRAALLQNADDRFQLVFGDGERRALDGGDALPGDRVAEIQRRWR